MIESDLENAFRYIQPTSDQYDVYSDHFAMIILSSASEIENALNSFAHEISYEPKPNGIQQYYSCIVSKYPSFCETEIAMPRFKEKFKPWQGWGASSAPDWWTNGYNKIKHDRLNHPKAPTLKRALESVAALQTLLLHYYRVHIPGVMMPFELEPRLLRIIERPGEFENAAILWHWDLPDEIKSRSRGAS